MHERANPAEGVPRLPLTTRRNAAGDIIFRRHPNGWTIWLRRVDEDRRGWTPRGSGYALGVGPKVYWEVKRAASSNKRREHFGTLTEARAWCDRHKDWDR